MLLEIHGHSLNVEDHGSQARPAVILLHHGLGSAAAWRQQLPALVQAGWRAIAYDRWGYGHSDFRAGIDMPAFTQDQADLLRLLDLLELGQVSLVGHSDGGTIALYFAAAHPERVHLLVTIAAHVYVEDKMQPSILALRRDFEQDTRFRSGLRRVHGEKVEQVFHNWFDGWVRDESLGWDMRPQLTAIPCPALVVQGEDDEHAAPQHAIDIAEAIPGAELWLVPGAGHMLPQDNAQVFNQRLIEFLGKYDRTGVIANERSE